MYIYMWCVRAYTCVRVMHQKVKVDDQIRSHRNAPCIKVYPRSEVSTLHGHLYIDTLPEVLVNQTDGDNLDLTCLEAPLHEHNKNIRICL